MNKIVNKLPEITLLFWIMKILATTFGETFGDLLAQTLNIGYGASSILFIGIFIAALIGQLRARQYHPSLYWLVIVATSTAGTTMSDFMDRTLGLGYGLGTSILVTILALILVFWKRSEKTISVNNITTVKGEWFYWAAILFSNTLGTALGDFLSDSSGLGYSGGALLITGLLLLIIAARRWSKISTVILFWSAFVLTRPFGATFGDLMTKSHAKGGLEFGTAWASLILGVMLIALIVYSNKKKRLI